MPSPFSVLPQAEPNLIMDLDALAKKAGPQAINATVGSIMSGARSDMPYLLPTVSRAINDVRLNEGIAYDDPLGVREYRTAVNRLLYGNRDHIANVATTGGSGAISMQLQLVKFLRPGQPIVVTMPAWAQHVPMCKQAGIPIELVPYFENGKPSVGKVVEKMRAGAGAVLLQAGGHNPSGLDYTADQWNELADELAKTDVLTVLDMAYQGIAGSPEVDREPLDILQRRDIPVLSAWSASKSHTMYNKRTGHASVAAASEDDQLKIEGLYKAVMKGTYSSSPGEGQRVVAQVQQIYPGKWKKDLADVRTEIDGKRALLQEQLPEQFQPALAGRGLFTQLPLTLEQIVRLRDEQRVFMLEDGRVNTAGIPLARVAEFCDKVKRVL